MSEGITGICEGGEGEGDYPFYHLFQFNLCIFIVITQPRVAMPRKKGVPGGVHPQAHLFFGGSSA